MKAAAVRTFAAAGCNANEISAFVGMSVYRVRWLLNRGGEWPRHGPKETSHNRERRELNRLVARLAA
jgi:hypothetical protein